jgi:DNA-binding NarL/FixJ family response regulator
VAVIAASRGEMHRAARLFAAGAALGGPVSGQAQPGLTTFVLVDERAYALDEQTLAAVRAALGEQTFAAAWAAGHALGFADILAEAVAAVEGLPEPVTSAGPADQYAGRTVPNVHPASHVELSEREATVLSLIATGHSNQEIADRLVLSVRTVERHAVNIYAKLGVRSRTEAVAYAIHHDLVLSREDAT